MQPGLGIHPVEVEDMVSFYAFLDLKPRGRCRIRLSKTPISLMQGAKEVAAALELALGLHLGETSADGAFTLEWTSDIGMADQEPAALIDGKILTELTPDDVPDIIAALRQSPGTALPKNSVRSSLALAGPLLAMPFAAGDGIRAALTRSPDQVVEEITKAKLRGRGGAGFPTGMKWRLTRKAVGQGPLCRLQRR
ncbi:MAG: NAD(P)H-dependent oxidoreductase subunit E [Aliidongia sp.]